MIDMATADRVSNAIVDILNTELTLMRQTGRIDGLALFAGQLLALKATERTMPKTRQPELLSEMFHQIDLCLAGLTLAKALTEGKTSTSKVCDFCGATGPTRMYAHPEIDSSFFMTLMKKGHWAACEGCGDAHEAGNFEELIRRHPSYGALGGIQAFRLELRRIYTQVSTTREAFLGSPEYAQKYPENASREN